MAALLLAGLAFTGYQKLGSPYVVGTSDNFPASSGYEVPGSQGLRDKHRNPFKFGKPSDFTNNKLYVPKIDVSDLTSFRHKWPATQEVYNQSYEETQVISKFGNGFGMGTWLLKNPLFCANNRRFGPRPMLKVDNLAVEIAPASNIGDTLSNHYY